MDKMNIKMLAIYTLMVVVITVLAVDSCHECPVDRVVDTVTEVEQDTIWQQVADTMPKELKPEKVIGKVTVPTIPDVPDGEAEDTQDADTAQNDSIQLDVVQRTFSDDSTYTAYVTGIKYQQWPKLDSILIRQREVTNTITKTITIQKKRSKWHVGLQAGYGYGLVSRRIEPYVGAGVGYSW